MNRLHILFTVMLVIVGALFATHQALAKILTGTAGDETHDAAFVCRSSIGLFAMKPFAPSRDD